MGISTLKVGSVCSFEDVQWHLQIFEKWFLKKKKPLDGFGMGWSHHLVAMWVL